MVNYEDMTEHELFKAFEHHTDEANRDYRDRRVRPALRALADIQEECDRRGIDFRPESFQPFWYK